MKLFFLSLSFVFCLNSVAFCDEIPSEPSTGNWQIITGSILFGTSYIFSVISAFYPTTRTQGIYQNNYYSNESYSYVRLIPIAGPFIDARNYMGKNDLSILTGVAEIIDGSLQVIGAGLLVWGIIQHSRYNDYVDGKVSLRPLVNQRFAGVLFRYNF